MSERLSEGVIELVREALAGTGCELVAGANARVYDARAPEPLRSQILFPAARGLVVVGSAGRELWSRIREANAKARGWDADHPLDDHVRRVLDRVDALFTREGISFRRFEPTLYASPALDFRAMGEIVGLGAMGPFGMLIHPIHGPWWALRGAYLVDRDLEAISLTPPCTGCDAPCVGGAGRVQGVAVATPEVRSRCVLGQASRYGDEQIAYHYDREETLVRLRALPAHQLAAR